MDEKLQLKLFKRFPELYRGKSESMQHNLMCFGFECCDGWFELLFELSSQIDGLAKEAGLTGEAYPKAAQVKEKFGGLRFYLDGGTDKMFDAIDKAEAASYSLCEVCGKPAERANIRGWVSTLCKEHRAAREACEDDLE